MSLDNPRIDLILANEIHDLRKKRHELTMEILGSNRKLAIAREALEILATMPGDLLDIEGASIAEEALEKIKS